MSAGAAANPLLWRLWGGVLCSDDDDAALVECGGADIGIFSDLRDDETDDGPLARDAGWGACCCCCCCCWPVNLRPVVPNAVGW